jgi:hypothetical protein
MRHSTTNAVDRWTSSMRGTDADQGGLFSYVSMEQRIPPTHPLRRIRTLLDEALGSTSRDFDRVYAAGGRESVAPERLVRALVLQVLQAHDAPYLPASSFAMSVSRSGQCWTRVEYEWELVGRGPLPPVMGCQPTTQRRKLLRTPSRR